VNWPRSTRPKDSGGLGILHLGKFARAQRLRWLWKEWDEEQQLQIGPDNPCTNNDKLLFAAATSIIVGDGDNISFWHSAWFQGIRPCDFAPNIYKLSRKKNR